VAWPFLSPGCKILPKVLHPSVPRTFYKVILIYNDPDPAPFWKPLCHSFILLAIISPFRTFRIWKDEHDEKTSLETGCIPCLKPALTMCGTLYPVLFYYIGWEQIWIRVCTLVFRTWTGWYGIVEYLRKTQVTWSCPPKIPVHWNVSRVFFLKETPIHMMCTQIFYCFQVLVLGWETYLVANCVQLQFVFLQLFELWS
jgi:hypothetical protein